MCKVNTIAFLSVGDANRQISEYKFTLSKAEQEMGTMEQNVSHVRLRAFLLSIYPSACLCMYVLNWYFDRQFVMLLHSLLLLYPHLRSTDLKGRY